MEASALYFSIAPDGEVDLGSASVEGFPWEGTREAIECNILILWPTPDGSPIIICSVDALYPGEDIRTCIQAEVSDTPPENIWVVASHTHRAPMLDRSKPKLGQVDQKHLETVLASLRTALKYLLNSERKPVQIEVGSEQAAHSVNRRRRQIVAPGRPPQVLGTALAPNYSGPVDESVTVISFREKSGGCVAAIWSYACHPVGSPFRNAVAGHYPALVRDDLRSSVGQSSLPVLFMQGFSGDARPNGTVSSEDRIVRRVLLGRTKFVDMTQSKYQAWTSSLSEVALRAFHRSTRIDIEAVRKDRIEVAGSEFGDIERPVVFQKLAFGDDLVLVGVSAEPVVEYSQFISLNSKYRYTIPVGCIDVPFGYIPTALQLREGGYEAKGFAEYFGVGRLNLDIERRVKENLLKILA